MNEKGGICVYLQLNDICNQKCLFCNRPPRERGGDIVPIEAVKNKIDELVADPEVNRIIFTGGEPTLYPYLKEVVSYVVSKNKMVEIQTNGTILDERGFRELKEAGLSIVNFAFHSHKDETSQTLRGVKFGCDRIKSGLIAANNVGLELHVIFVINKINFTELPDFIDYISQLDINWSKFWLNLSIVVPEGWAWENSAIVVPRMRDISPYLVEACKRCVKNKINFDISEFVPLCVVPGFEHRAVSTVFKVSNIKIIDDYYDGKRILDFFDPNENLASKAKQCITCSLDKICVGFYPRLKTIYGEEDYEPSTLDPISVINRIKTEED